MVPMAPSSTRMRSRAAASKAVRLFGNRYGHRIRRLSVRPAGGCRADGRWRTRGPRGSWCRNERCRRRAWRASAPGRPRPPPPPACGSRRSSSRPSNFFASQSGTLVPARVTKLRGLLEILHRHDAGHDRNVDAARAHAIEVAEVEIVIEEELGDGARRAGIDLGLQHVDVGVEVGALRMLFRIGRDRDLDIGIALLDAGDEVGRGLVAVGMRGVGACRCRSVGSPRSATMWRTPTS